MPTTTLKPNIVSYSKPHRKAIAATDWRLRSKFWEERRQLNSTINDDEYRALRRLAFELRTTMVGLTTIIVRAGLDPANHDYLREEVARERRRKS